MIHLVNSNLKELMSCKLLTNKIYKSVFKNSNYNLKKLKERCLKETTNQ